MKIKRGYDPKHRENTPWILQSDALGVFSPKPSPKPSPGRKSWVRGRRHSDKAPPWALNNPEPAKETFGRRSPSSEPGMGSLGLHGAL